MNALMVFVRGHDSRFPERRKMASPPLTSPLDPIYAYPAVGDKGLALEGDVSVVAVIKDRPFS
jgi:hypothetical protein